MGNERTRTFIKGLDDVLGGGIPEKKVVLIKGHTGSMKSSVAYYILYRNAEMGKPSLYITLEQDRQSLEQQMTSLGLDVEKVSKNLHIFDLSKGKERIEEIVGKLKGMGTKGSKGSGNKDPKDAVAVLLRKEIGDLRRKSGFELLVIDSLDALRMVLNPESQRASMFEFFEWMRKLGLTCFVVSERSIQPMDTPTMEPEYEDFLADGIIELKMELINNVDIQRRVRCIKMRGTEHSTDYYSLFCNNGYFEIEKALTY